MSRVRTVTEENAQRDSDTTGGHLPGTGKVIGGARGGWRAEHGGRETVFTNRGRKAKMEVVEELSQNITGANQKEVQGSGLARLSSGVGKA